MPIIITGVDGSETAARAAQTAAELAAALRSDLVIVSAFGRLEVERLHVGSDEFVLSSETSAQEIAEEAAQNLRKGNAGVKISVRTEEGRPAEALLRVAESLEARLIVVGNKRVQGLVRVLGSIAADVAQKAHCDVYIAHTHTRS